MPSGAPRIALFGGTFDPPHNGHLAVARAAADAFQLDCVLFCPVGRQPLKPGPADASYDDRVTMTALACEENLQVFRDTRFVISTLDAPLPDGRSNFSVDTLTALAKSNPAAEIYNILGRDSFAGLVQWHEPQRLLRACQWIVVSRPGFPLADPVGLVINPQDRRLIHFLNTVHVDVSASELRERLRAGDPCTDLLPMAVAGYIRANDLYRV